MDTIQDLDKERVDVMDADLVQRFRCMGTTDRDVMISELQRLLGFQLDPAGCTFFLDMTDWNLQDAVGKYYDLESPVNECPPSMSLVGDVTVGEGESVPPDTAFTKTWTVRNAGGEPWPPGVCLRYVGGDRFGHVGAVAVGPLEPCGTCDVSVAMRSPGAPGIYQGRWRMCTSSGLLFGDMIWVILNVEVGGLLGVTQQLSSSLALEFNARPRDRRGNAQGGDFNPFALRTEEERA